MTIGVQDILDGNAMDSDEERLRSPPPRSGLNNSTPNLHSLLERQFATAQQVLATQHQQALRVIEHYCNQVALGHGSSLPGVVGSSSVSPFVGLLNTSEMQSSEKPPTGMGAQRLQPPLSIQAVNKKLATHSSGDARKYLPDRYEEQDGKSSLNEIDSLERKSSKDRGTSLGRIQPAQKGGSQERASSPEADFQKVSSNLLGSRCGPLVTRRQNTQEEKIEKTRRSSLHDAKSNAKAAIKRSKEEGSDRKKDAPRTVFADAADMKAKVKESIMKPDYNVANFYKTEGIWQQVARTQWFDNLTLVVIALNALWISIDTDYNHAETLTDADVGFQIGENTFCIYFSVELFVRFMAFRRKRDGLKDGWFVFDSALVGMMVMETWMLNLVFFILGGGSSGSLGNASILRLVRLLRLTRMARMVRLLRAMPELMILVKGMSVATRVVFWTLCLLLIFIYVFGIAFTQLAKDTPLEQEYFPTVPKAMSTLLLRGTLPDLHEFVVTIGDESGVYACLAMIFILLTTLTVMNMLVGVLCEVINVVSAVEKEQMTVQFVKSKLLALISEAHIDQDANKSISKDEFEKLLLLPEGARIIEEVGVDVVGLVDFADDIFKDGIELSFPDFMELVLQLRSNNTATVRDIVDLRKLISSMFTEFTPLIETQIEKACEGVLTDAVSKIEEVTTAMKGFPRHQPSLPPFSQGQLDNGWTQPPQPQVADGNSKRSLSPPRSAGAQRRPAPGTRPSSVGQDRPYSAQQAELRRRQGPEHSRPNSANPCIVSRGTKTQGGAKAEAMTLPVDTWLTEYEDEGNT